MSKYITLPSTVTTTTLSLVKSLAPAPAPAPVPVVYTTPYYKLAKTPHISVLIHSLKTSDTPSSMLPYLVGLKLALRGTHHKYVRISPFKIPTSYVIISATSTGVITLSGLSHHGYPVKLHVSTFTVSLTVLIKMLKSGTYTLLV